MKTSWKPAKGSLVKKIDTEMGEVEMKKKLNEGRYTTKKLTEVEK